MDKDKHHDELVEEVMRVLELEYTSNPEFNTFFDGGTQVEVDSLLNPDPYSFEKSHILFWLDRPAYDDEKAGWENRTIQDKHKDAVDFVRSTGQRVQLLDLVEAVKRQRVVPFIGAGLCKPMGLPLWAEALAQGEFDFKVHHAGLDVIPQRASGS
jgi:hypothetical protein